MSSTGSTTASLKRKNSMTPNSYEIEMKRAEKRRMLKRSTKVTFFQPVFVDREDSSSSSDKNDNKSPSPELELVSEETKPEVRQPEFTYNSDSDNEPVEFTFQVVGSADASPERPQSDQTPPRRERTSKDQYDRIKDQLEAQRIDAVLGNKNAGRRRTQAETPAQLKGREIAITFAADGEEHIGNGEGLLGERRVPFAPSSSSISASALASWSVPTLRLGL